MKQTVIYRPFKKEDIKELTQVISQSWNYEALFSPSTAKHFAHLFLYFELARKTFAQVAEIAGKPVGIIICEVKKPKIWKNFAYYPKLLKHGISLLLSKEGRGVLFKYAADVARKNNQMLKDTGEEFDTEVALFAVSPHTQGLGVGSKLFQYFLDAMKEQELKSFFLYTDTTCNYKFYERKGLKRIADVKRFIPYPLNKEINFFIYKGIAD